MTSASARWLAALVAVGALATGALVVGAPGCGAHQLDLALALASDSCTSGVPASGSILFQVTPGSGGIDGGGARAFCGACLAVPSPLADANAILAFLRANAPACPGIAPGGTLRVALTAYGTPDCTDSTTSPKIFCSTSPEVPLPDGRADAVVSVVLTCDVGCAGICRPTTCAALGKNCGTVSDGCNGMLSCGSCTPPLKCGGHGGSGTPNVCSQ